MNLEFIIPVIEFIRNILLKISGFIAPLFDLQETNIYFILIVIFAILSSKKIIEFIFTTTDGKKIYWIILTLIIFWVLKYLGVN